MRAAPPWRWRTVLPALLLRADAQDTWARGGETSTDTFTSTIPTSTSTYTTSLPTVSATYTMPTAVASETVTDSATLTLPTGSTTLTLPAATATSEITLPTTTATVSLPSASATETGTVTLPATSSTETFTQSASMSLPTFSESATFSLPTHTVTTSGTVTMPSVTTSSTATATLTLPAHDNYTMYLEPATFYDGQEIRIQLKATQDGGANNAISTRSLEMFNSSAMGTLAVRMYAWSADMAGDCERYAAGGRIVPLAETREFGMSRAERYEGNVWVGAAFTTLTTPHAGIKFLICFRHTVPKYMHNSPAVNKWMLFSTSDGGLGQYIFQAKASGVWFHLPEATDGQYAIIQLLSKEAWNFTYAPSSCGAGTYSENQAMSCGLGDNLKIVPSGEPCTLEHQELRLPYLGSNWVQTDGRWDREAIDGLRIGATAGGVGRFGTQYANPLVDTWTSWGTYYPANEESNTMNTEHTGTTTGPWSAYRQDYINRYAHHAYVYVRLPQAPGKRYDVCLSSREQRVEWRTSNSSIDAVPMWRKLYRCSSPAACVSRPEDAGGRSLVVLREPIGWSMYDLTPNTWGTIVFDDSAATLSSEPSGTTVLVNAPIAIQPYPVAVGAAAGYTNTANYWSPQGGDYFRIVKASKFGEGLSWSANGFSVGSFPAVGCWDRSLDDAQTGLRNAPQQGGWVSDGAEYPIGSRDLTGDPTEQNPPNDASAQRRTFATLWLPSVMSRWYVCYRRTCGSGASCVRNTGLRVLPWHDAATNALGYSAVPVKFLHLEREYTPRVGAELGAVPLVPGYHGDDLYAYPPPVAWYMNDTRSMTWGPIVVEKVNYSDVAKLDSRPWDGVRLWAEGGCAAAVAASSWSFGDCAGAADCDQLQCTKGSALRLVRSDKPCDWPGFIGSTTQGANATDGGAVECNSWDATNDVAYCAGRRADSPAVSTVAFYITVPEVVPAPAGYRVCFRLHAWNWREVWPAREGPTAWGDAFQPSGARQRGDWRLPNLGTTHDTSPDNGGADNWYQATTDARDAVSLAAVEDRATMEALFVVSDTRGELSAAPRRPCPGGCEDSGDVLRLVPMHRTCDIYPNQIDSGGWDPDLADWHLSALCPTPGAGILAQSGLYTNATVGHSPCSAAGAARALCKGMVCDSSLSAARQPAASARGDAALLADMLSTVPDLYDDIVPFENTLYNVKTVAANIQLPVLRPTATGNRYKLCYKQMATANWLIFNDTWEVQPAPGMTALLVLRHDQEAIGLTDLADGVTLIGGEQQLFAVRFPHDVATSLNELDRPRHISSFYAKLVKITGDLNHCLNPAGGTEGAPFAAATRMFVAGGSRAEIRFALTVPHEPGQYDLCVQARASAEDSMSWWRGGRPDGSRQRITVADSGVRYYVTPGHQPTNQGQVVVSFVRCTPPPPPPGPAPPDDPARPRPCDYSGNQAVFDTNPGGDAAKIVPVTAACEPRQQSWSSPYEAVAGAHCAQYSPSAAGVSWVDTLGECRSLCDADPGCTGCSYNCVSRRVAVLNASACTRAASACGSYTQLKPPSFTAARVDPSLHVGRRVFGAARGGVTDLGPDDGNADVAEMVVALPAAPNDTRVNYKVCISTSFTNRMWQGTRRAWVEVAQAANLPGQVTVRDVYTGRPAFQTAPARASHWTIDPALRPAAVALSGAASDMGGASSAALAGAATRLVDQFAEGGLTPSRVGFAVGSYPRLGPAERARFGSGNLFKLVAVQRPRHRAPAPGQDAEWGAVGDWADEEGASCFSPGAASANNEDPCSAPWGGLRGGAACPTTLEVISVGSAVTVPLLFQVPLAPGKYIVCYKLNASGAGPQPWLLLRTHAATDGGYGDRGEGAGYLYSLPSFLEFEADAPAAGGSTINVTFYDLRTVVNSSDGVPQPLSSWCAPLPEVRGEGAPCHTVNTATTSSIDKTYYQDLVTAVNSSQVCPTPYDGPTGMGLGGTAGVQTWWPLLRTGNLSARVAAGEGGPFALPPATPDTGGLQKLCVWKAGEGSYGPYADQRVTKRGIVYQVYNRGDAASGGGTGHWRDGHGGLGAAAQLIVAPELDYNATLRFVEHVAANAETQTLFGPTFVPDVLVTDPVTGTLSRTPLLRSGTTVAFTVRAATASGELVPSGSYPVSVHRCAAPTGWDALGCPLASAKAPEAGAQPFELANGGGACAGEEAARYGWPRNGLTQFARRGAARFALQYRSGCGGGEFGCGVRFVGRPAAAAADIVSLPQWVNIEDRHVPDAVALGQGEGETSDLAPAALPPTPKCEAGSCPAPCVPPRCFQLSCLHGLPCALRVQARFEGPPEYAPAGRVAVRFSSFDYPELRAAPDALSPPPALAAALRGIEAAAPAPWAPGGAALARFSRPEIRDEARGAEHAFLNVTWSGAGAPPAAAGWTRVVVRVSRLEPARVLPGDLRALDLESYRLARLDREPAPRLRAAVDGAGLSAEEGCYLEALMPYELRYAALGPNGQRITPAEGMAQWRLSASFAAAPAREGNKVLAMVNAVDGLAEENLLTYPAYTSDTFGSQVPVFDGNGWFLRFRIYNNKGCSRFGGGCTIRFVFSKDGVEHAPTMTVTSPVRVHGSTLWVTTHEVHNLAATAAAPAWDGLLVRAYPGTPCGGACGFLYDEWAWGGVFGLINSPQPADGVTNRDKVRIDTTGELCAYSVGFGRLKECTVSMYNPRPIVVDRVTYWAASWVMRPNVPCYNCEFTFHSQSGAGPYTYGDTPYAVHSLTFTQGGLRLACNRAEVAVVDLPWFVGQPRSEFFTVEVMAAQEDDYEASARWPRWWTWIDTASDVHGPGDFTLASLFDGAPVFRRQLGDGGSAVYDALYFALGTATRSPEADVGYSLTFRALSPSYNSSVDGAVPMFMQPLTCTAEVNVFPREPAPPPEEITRKYLRITGVDRATCVPAAGGCTRWYTTADQLQPDKGGLVVRLLFTQRTGGRAEVADSAPRNATVIPAVSPGDTLEGATSMLAFAPDNSTQKSVAYLNDGQPLPSFYNPMEGKHTRVVGGPEKTFTFGQIAVRFERTSPAVASRVLITITYDDNQGRVFPGVGWPVRDARIRYCGTVWENGAESLERNNITADVCIMMQLWVLPTAATPHPSKTALFWDWPAAAESRPGLAPDPLGAPRCGPSPATLMDFSVMAFYSLPASVNGSDPYLFIVYDSPVQYTLRLGIQSLVPAADQTLANSSLTRAAEPGEAALGERIANTHPFSALRAWFSVYGLDQMQTPAAATVTAVDLSDPQAAVSPTRSPVEYIFVHDKETFASWEVLDEVRYDDECPSRRLLTVNRDDSGYRTHEEAENIPGSGWEYTDGAAVGVPFPVQTVVQIAGRGRGSGGDRRAWTFAADSADSPGRSLVAVKKQSWSGCNDGGALTTHNLAPAAPAQRFTPVLGLVSSWGPNAGIYTNRGVATAWVAMQQPCQSCTLQLSLCYMGATGAADCLQNPANTSSDTRPLLADRSKVTRPFAVRRPEPHRLQIYAQRTPATPSGTDEGVINVGQGFSVEVEAVLQFGRWTVRSPVPVAVNLWADAEWSCTSGECRSEAGSARYGNGGFLQAPASDSELAQRLQSRGCDAVSRAQLAAAALHPRPRVTASAVPTSGTTLAFYFTRPCSACAVRLWYGDFGETGQWKQDRSITLRSYRQNHPAHSSWWKAGDVLVYSVRTCAAAWEWGGGALHLGMSFRKRRPWSVTVWRADRNKFPTWEGDPTATFEPITEQTRNGGWADLTLTSPEAWRVKGAVAVDGAATIRVQTARACYRCRAMLGGQGYRKLLDVVSLADATQIVAIPFPAHGLSRREQTAVQVADMTVPESQQIAGLRALWAFEVYAADEHGERAYTVGGPTPQPYQPRYSDHAVPPSKLEVAPPPTVDTLAGVPMSVSPSHILPVRDSQGNTLITSISDGQPHALAVTNGTVVYNGIPFGELNGEKTPPGVAVVQASGTGSHVPLSFSMPGAPNVPTRYFGGKGGITLSFTVPATHLALENAAELGCKSPREGGSCAIRAYAVGHRPGFPSTVFQLSTAHNGTATAAAQCDNGPAPGSPALCRMFIASAADFRDGVATFTARFASGNPALESCSCSVSVAAEDLQQSPQVLPITFARKVPTKFAWTGSATMNVPVGGRDVDTVLDRTVTLTLFVTTDLGETFDSYDWGGAFFQDTLNAAGMDPFGCFVQQGAGLIMGSGATIEFVGSFMTTSAEGLCTIYSSALGALPLPLDENLRAAPKVPAGLRVVQAPTVHGALRDRGQVVRMLNFTGLTALTASGLEAAVSGEGATLTLLVVDRDGAQVLGDHHTVATLTGLGRAAGLRATAVMGVITFRIDFAGRSTRARSQPPNAEAPVAVHNPIRVDVTAAATQSNGSVWNPAGVAQIGDLYFVRRPVHLWVEVATGMDEPRAVLNLALKDRLEVAEAAVSAMAGNEAVDSAAWPPALRRMTQLGQMFANATDQLRLVTGFPFDIMISAVDHTGLPVTHTEDLNGGDVMVIFRPVAIPCADADRLRRGIPWVADTCIQGAKCKTISWAGLPSCGTNGWSYVPPGGDGEMELGEFDIKAGDGFVTLSDVRYTGPRDGPTRFQLTVARSGVFDTGYVFLAELNIQRMDRLCVLSSRWGACMVCGPHPDRDKSTSVDQCEVPNGLVPLRRDETLSLYVAVIDEGDQVVRGDSVTQIAVRSSCRESLTFAGVGGDFVTPPKFEVRKGIAAIDDLEFDGACGNMTLTFDALPGSVRDSEGQAARLRGVEIVPFEVAALPGDTPAPPPDLVSPPPVTISIKLKQFAPMELTAAQRDVRLFATSISPASFNLAMTKLITGSIAVASSAELTYVCGVPQVVSGLPVPNGCKDGSGGPGFFAGCFCTGFTEAAARAAAPLQGANVALAAKAVVDVKLNPNAGSAFNDNPEAVSDLVAQIAAAIKRDLTSGNSILRNHADSAFKDTDPNDLGMSGEAKATPSPPGNPNTPKPTAPPSAGPVTAGPTLGPATSSPTEPPTVRTTFAPAPPSAPPTLPASPLATAAPRRIAGSCLVMAVCGLCAAVWIIG